MEMSTKLRLRLTTWVAFSFFASGAFLKFARIPIEVAFFHDANLPAWMMTFMGFAEATIAILLIPHSTSTVGAILGAAVMVGAMFAVIVTQWWFLLPLPPMTFAMLVFIGWSRRDGLFDWAGTRTPIKGFLD